MTSPAILPRAVIDLASWKLTLPVNAANQLRYDVAMLSNGIPVPNPSAHLAESTAATITPLTNDYTSAWFNATISAGVPELVLSASVHGSTTTPRTLGNFDQSDHARTELRSILQGKSAAAGCFRRDDLPLMKGNIRVDHRPVAGGSLVLAQIHPNSGKTFVLLKLTSDGRLLGVVTAFDQLSNDQVQFASGVKLGDQIEFRLGYGGGDVVTWKITVNGVLKGTFTQAVEAAWALIDLYFKCGAYTSIDVLDSADAPNVVAGILAANLVTDFTRVAIRQLVITLGASSSSGGKPKVTRSATAKPPAVTAARPSRPTITRG